MEKNCIKNLFTVLKKLKECVGFFFFNNLIATNGQKINEVLKTVLTETIFIN